jgi:hypothetical protein
MQEMPHSRTQAAFTFSHYIILDVNLYLAQRYLWFLVLCSTDTIYTAIIPRYGNIPSENHSLAY